MMIMRSELVLGPIGCLLLFGLVGAIDENQNRYPIQMTQLSEAPDIITHMRHFMPKTMQPEERCKRIAIVLYLVNASAKKSMSDFKVADWSMTKVEFVREHFGRISIEQLRELYTNTILQYHDKNRVDGGLLETIECLRSKFSRGNGKVRVFMRQPWLTKIVEQYGQISRSPASKLVSSQDDLGYDDQDNFGELRWSELEQGVQSSIINWMSGDRSRAAGLFADGVEYQQHYAEPKQATASHAKVQPDYHQQTQLPPVAPVQQLQQPQQTEVLQAPPPQANVPTAESEQVQPSEQHVETEANQQTEIIDNDDDQFDYNSIEWEEIYQDENLNEVFENIHRNYQEKIDQKLGARCKAYSDSMGIQTPALTDPDATFVPDSEARDSFLWIVRLARKLFDIDSNAWFDLIDCVDQWQDLDKEAKIFINHPSTSDLFSQMLDETEQEEHSSQASSASKAK